MKKTTQFDSHQTWTRKQYSKCYRRGFSEAVYDYMCIGRFVTFSTKTLISPLIIFSAIRIWQKLSNNFN